MFNAAMTREVSPTMIREHAPSGFILCSASGQHGTWTCASRSAADACGAAVASAAYGDPIGDSVYGHSYSAEVIAAAIELAEDREREARNARVTDARLLETHLRMCNANVREAHAIANVRRESDAGLWNISRELSYAIDELRNAARRAGFEF